MWFIGSEAELTQEPLRWLADLDSITVVNIDSLDDLIEKTDENQGRLLVFCLQRGKLGKQIQPRIRQMVQRNFDVVIVDMHASETAERLAVQLGCKDYIWVPISRRLFLARLKTCGIQSGNVIATSVADEPYRNQYHDNALYEQGALSNFLVNLLSSQKFSQSGRSGRIRHYARVVLTAYSRDKKGAVAELDHLADHVARIAFLQELGAWSCSNPWPMRKGAKWSRAFRCRLPLLRGAECQSRQLHEDHQQFLATAGVAIAVRSELQKDASCTSYLEKRVELPLMSQLFILLDAYDASFFNRGVPAVRNNEESVAHVLRTAGAVVAQPILEAFCGIEKELRFVALQWHSGQPACVFGN